MKRTGSSPWLPFAVAVVAFTLLRAPAAHAQQATLQGTVTAEGGAPVENANVYIQEMNISVAANAAGHYVINIPAERVRGQSVVLRIRAIGKVAQQRPVTLRAGSQTFDFVLREDINKLDAIVTTGVSQATSQKQTTFTVTSLNAEQDMPVASTSPLEGLAGKVPGASVVGGNGRPGTAPDILLRGAHSIESNGRSQGPLILVDGVILNGNSTDIDPESIESVEVVKGAAGASMYGSLGENGVISIHTKRGNDAGAGIRIDARQEQGFSNIQGTYDFPTLNMFQMDATNTRYCIKQSGLPNCARTIDWDTEAARINNVPTPYTATPYTIERDYGFSTAPPSTKYDLKGLFMTNQFPKRYDPVSQVEAPNAYVNSTINLSGKQDNTSYYTSFNQTITEGAVKYQRGYTRQSARANIDQSLGSHFTTSIQTMYSRGMQYPNGTSWFGLTRTHPEANLNATDIFGHLYYRADITAETSQDSNDNPNYFTKYTDQGGTRDDRFIGSMTSTYTFTDWLNFQATTAVDERRSSGVFIDDKNSRSAAPTPGGENDGFMTTNTGYNLSYNVNAGFNANRDLTRDLNAKLSLNYTFDDQNSDGTSSEGDVLTLPGLLTLSNAQILSSATYGASAQRDLGFAAGYTLSYKDRYVYDGSIRREGSSLFGTAQRWHNYGRNSFAWIASDEPWWFFPNAFDSFKLRAAIGTAGGRPSFSQQYETYNIGTGGSITANTLGNKLLRPEHDLETEYGWDAELFHKYGLSLTYARDITSDQILAVPPSVSSGFSSQWLNAGTMDSRTWEASLNVPLITRRSFLWTSRLGWDQTRSYITEMNVPPFFATNTNANVYYAPGQRYGNVYGWQFVKSCSQLPSDFAARCGAGKEWQQNDQGYVVWVGQGNSWQDGVTKNLWQSELLGCTVGGVPTNGITGSAACVAKGGTVNTPWGQPVMHWGMPIEVRDSTGQHKLSLLGNAQPLWHLTWSHNLTYKRWSAYALLDKMFGNHIYNQDRAWSYGDFMQGDISQVGKTVATAKPLGYYWRGTSPENGAGVGGFYSVLGPNSVNFEDASYLKLREADLSYNIGALPRIPGNWSLTLIGRNLYTWTKYTGWDPDQGTGGGNTGSGTLFAAQASSYPAFRTFSFTVSSKF